MKSTESINPPTSQATEDFISTQKAADLLGISLRSVQYWVENGKLNAWKTAGGHRRIAVESVNRLMQEQNQAKSTLNNPSRKKVLVVEDEPDLLEYYRLHMHSWQLPINIITAENGFEGLMQIGQHNPDIIITDLVMPDMDGFTMIQAINQKIKNTGKKIIVVTRLNEKEINNNGGLDENIIVFQKPVPIKKIRQVIYNHIENNNFRIRA
ncbi:MAG: response regulator [Gammaproteobacteria bacterium]|nr:response regulator [Gammaproteobacteria bacterium]